MPTANLKEGWFSDHAPGRGKIIGASLVGPAGGYYFEVQDVGSSAGGVICIGVASSLCLLEKPWQQSVGGGGTPNGVFVTCGNNGNIGGRAYINNPNSTIISLVTDGVDRIGVAVDTAAGLIWWRNATASPGVWLGHGAAGYTTANVIAGTGGFHISSTSTDDGPISGPIFICVGCSWDGTGVHSQCTLNTGLTSFTASAPTGFSAWDSTGASGLNPNDQATEIVLSAANLHMTSVDITGANQPVALVRSNTSKLRS